MGVDAPVYCQMLLFNNSDFWSDDHYDYDNRD